MVSPAMTTLSHHPALDSLNTCLIAVRTGLIAFVLFDPAYRRQLWYRPGGAVYWDSAGTTRVALSWDFEFPAA